MNLEGVNASDRGQAAALGRRIVNEVRGKSDGA
jgi:hypothetical protein